MKSVKFCLHKGKPLTASTLTRQQMIYRDLFTRYLQLQTTELLPKVIELAAETYPDSEAYKERLLQSTQFAPIQ